MTPTREEVVEALRRAEHGIAKMADDDVLAAFCRMQHEALVQCECELNNYYENEYAGDHPYSVHKREQNIAANPATPIIAMMPTEGESDEHRANR